jgi:hypothetical protein
MDLVDVYYCHFFHSTKKIKCLNFKCEKNGCVFAAESAGVWMEPLRSHLSDGLRLESVRLRNIDNKTAARAVSL